MAPASASAANTFTPMLEAASRLESRLPGASSAVPPAPPPLPPPPVPPAAEPKAAPTAQPAPVAAALPPERLADLPVGHPAPDAATSSGGDLATTPKAAPPPAPTAAASSGGSPAADDPDGGSPAADEPRPAPAAAAVEGTVMPPSPDAPQPRECATNNCAFCLHPFGDKETESLVCGHVFHSGCLQDYLTTTGKSKALCCPFKCYQWDVSFGEPAVEINDGDDAEGASSTAASSTDTAVADAAMAVEAHNAATQLFT